MSGLACSGKNTSRLARLTDRWWRRGLNAIGSLKYAASGCRSMTAGVQRLEVVRDAGDDGVVGEEGVAVFRVVLKFRDAGWAVAIESPWAVDGDGGAAEVVHQAGVERDDATGATEAVAVAQQVAYGNAFC